jgi:hypothetical protein
MTFGEWVKIAVDHLWDGPAPPDDPTKACSHESTLREKDGGTALEHIESRIVLTIKGRGYAEQRGSTGETANNLQDRSDSQPSAGRIG